MATNKSKSAVKKSAAKKNSTPNSTPLHPVGAWWPFSEINIFGRHEPKRGESRPPVQDGIAEIAETAKPSRNASVVDTRDDPRQDIPEVIERSGKLPISSGGGCQKCQRQQCSKENLNETVNQPLTVFVVDDEPLARRRLLELLDDCSTQIALEVVGEAGNGHEALEKLSAKSADVALLDIRMPQMDGLELALHLNKLERPPAIIFTTAYDTYAVQAFERRAIDYLLKPIRINRLIEALTRVHKAVPPRAESLREMMSKARTHLSVRERGRVVPVPIEDVIYFRAEMRYITIHTARRKYLLEESLTALEKEYAERFVRIHRSFLVAKSEIAGFKKGKDRNKWSVNLRLRKLDEQLPVSRRQWSSVKGLISKNVT